MLTERIKTIIILICRLVVGIVFVYASFDKLFNPELFAKSIANYRMLNTPLIAILAVSLPWAEFLCGLCLIIGIWTRGAALLVSGMLVMFIIAIVQALFRGLDISCGCFDITETGQHLGLGLIIRDILLLAMSMYIIYKANGKLSLKPDAHS